VIGGGDGLALSARGLIADTASAALVAADGTIDWWCPGRYDAPATFYRLLDRDGGALRVGPAGPPRPGRQRYDEGTLVLRTELPAREGAVEVCDLMPWDGGVSTPDGQRLVRIVTARTDADVDVDVVPGHHFAPVERVERFDGGVAFAGTVVHGESRCMRAGDRMVVTTGEPLSVDAALDLERRTVDAWRSFLSPLGYDGPYRDAVRRSLLTLKALTYHRTGAVVAAVTTSLPEQVGGERNWDYRYAWLRDASLAVDATHDAGLREEVETFNRWLLRVVEDAELPLAPVYDVEGDPVPDEEELRLAGWRRSQPVRVGNAAARHLQLDIYADIVSAVHVHQLERDSSVVELWDGLAAMADWLSDGWAQPDRGVWEVRGEPRQLVSSKLAAWYALDRMVTLARAQNPLDLSAPGWLLAARQIEAWLEEHGLAIDGGLRQDDTAADAADAALLRVAWRGPWPSDHPVVTATIDRVLKRLGDGPHVHRYGTDGPGDGLPGREGAFVACSFWAVRALARVGRWEEAHDRMERLVALSGPLGLLPEEVDPLTGAWLGNLPQALSHLALVQAALELARGPR
jgi:GH15 family glucan-1,4-alpha-glucosidase